ncbi:MAG: T9SS type A sorting domain-containing protein [Tannerella sp.]|jgi:hypothetical protein|nr:T9SS type A sorting domain-containing protein [Tannerella sp.]
MIKRLLQTARLSLTAKGILGTVLHGSCHRGIAATLAVLLWAAGGMNVRADETVNINTVTEGESGPGWDFNSSTLNITANGDYTITGAGAEVDRPVKVSSGLTNVNITLHGVNIKRSSGDGHAFDMSGATVKLILEETNLLTASSRGAGIHVPSGGATLTITAESESAGSLTATGSDAAGIGGGFSDNGSGGASNAGCITITGGTVTATVTGQGAGIGGGRSDDNNSNAGTVAITGGTVTATGGGGGGAGIGGGYSERSTNNGGTVTITGGTVTATGGGGGAGIGGGWSYEESSNGGTVAISGGTVTATVIGGGHSESWFNSDGAVTITGGSIKAGIQPQPKDGAGDNVYLNTLTVGSTPAIHTAITAGSINGIACDATNTPPLSGYGIKDVTTDAGGKVYFYLTPTAIDETVELTTSEDKTYAYTYTRSGDHTGSETLSFSYGISIIPTGTYVFPSLGSSYAAPAPLTATVTNDGIDATGLTVALSGANPGAFALSASSLPNITTTGGSEDFTVAPVTGLSAGTYTATVTVAGDHGIRASFDVEFTVTAVVIKPTPTDSDLDYALPAGLVYTGRQQGMARPTPKSSVTGLGAVTVKYRGTGGTAYSLSTTPPVNAGTYEVTVDIAEGATYAAATGLVLGRFTIAQAAPTVGDFAFDLPEEYVFYDGLPKDAAVTPKDTTNMGHIAVKYNGSTEIPTEPGIYVVTVEVAGNANYAATIFELGRLVILDLADPTIRRAVTIEPSPYFTVDPAPGIHHVESHRDLVLTLTPTALLPEGYLPVVTTSRRTLPDDEDDGLQVTASADGSYAVRIRYITENLVVSITASADLSTASATLAGPSVWSRAGRLYIAAATSGSARIYEISGRLLKTFLYAAGETIVQSLPAGIYIVTLNGRTSYKVIIRKN